MYKIELRYMTSSTFFEETPVSCTAQHRSAMKEAYLIEIKKMRAVGNTDPMNSLPHRKKGRSED